jgi:Leucine-rich repeat (LRR) protein
MEVNELNTGQSTPPAFLQQGNMTGQQDDMEIASTSLLPLHGYHTHQHRISMQALPLQAINAQVSFLPAELIDMIQAQCSYRDLQALTSVNHAAFALRFHNPRLQHLHFNTAAQVKAFLACCRETQQTASLTGAIRIREDFQQVKILSLTLSKHLNSEQCEPLFAYLPGVDCLKIRPAAGQRIASLGPLCKAARYLALKHLAITGPLLQYRLKFDEDALPDELWQWSTLETLELLTLDSITRISEDIGKLTRLTSLHLRVPFCAWSEREPKLLVALPESLGQLTKLEKFVLSGFSALLKLPEAIGQLSALKSLTLRDMNLNALPASLGQLQKLEQLDLSGLNRIRNIPEQIGQLTALKSLRLTFMNSLNALPASLGQLAKLERLELIFLNGIEAIPEEIGQLKALRSLRLNTMQSLRVLPASLGQLEKLEQFYLCRLNRIDKLPEAIGQLNALKSLRLSFIELKALPASLGQLDKLEQLELNSLGRIENISEEIGQLSALKSLTLSNMKSLRALSAHFGQLDKLEQLELDGLDRLEAIPEEIGQLSALKSLILNNMKSLQTLSANFGQLAKLEQLELNGLYWLEAIPEEIGQLKALQSLTLSNMKLLNALPASIGQLQKLKQLVLRDLGYIEEFPEQLGQLNASKSLTCAGGGALPASLWQLRKLEQLDLSYLDSMQEIDQLTALKSLTLRDMHLNSLNQAMVLKLEKLVQLEQLHLRGRFGSHRNTIREIYIGQLIALKSITLHDFPKLQYFGESKLEYPRESKLEYSGESKKQLNNLREIILSGQTPFVNSPVELQQYTKRYANCG